MTGASPLGGKARTLGALLVFFFALAVRLVGIGWGLPNELRNQSLHPDELVVYNLSQEIQPARLDFVPLNYNYPTLYPSLLRLLGDAAVIYSGAPDPLREGKALTPERWRQLAEHSRVFHLTGRSINCLAGAGMAVCVFLMLLRVSGLAGASFGAALVALSPALLVHSRWQTVDTLATFLMTASLYAAVGLVVDPSLDSRGALRWSILAGAFAGLSAGTKYAGIVVLLALLTALAIRRPEGPMRLASASVGAALAAFFISTPGALLNAERFRDGVLYEMRHTSEWRGLLQGDVIFAETPSGFVYHLINLSLGAAPAACALGVLGLAIAAYRRHPWAWVVLVGLLPYYLLIGRAEVKFSRYALPLFVGVGLGFGYAVGAAWRRPRLRVVGAIAGCAALVGVENPLTGVRGALTYSRWMQGEDPRDQAARYVLEAARQNPRLAVGLVREPWYYTAPVFADANYSFHLPPEVRAAMIGTTSTPRVVFPVEQERTDFVVVTDLEVMHAERVGSSSNLSMAERQTVDTLLSRLEVVRLFYRRVREFGEGPQPWVDDLRYVQPRVTVYERADRGA